MSESTLSHEREIELATLRLSTRLKKAIRESDLTQKDAASLIGISENTLSNYVRGKRIPDSITLARLSSLLGCDPGWLLTGSSSGKPVTFDNYARDRLNTIENTIGEVRRELNEVAALEDHLKRSIGFRIERLAIELERMVSEVDHVQKDIDFRLSSIESELYPIRLFLAEYL